MEAGTVTVDNASPWSRAKEWGRDHPARAAMFILGVLFLLVIASKGLHDTAEASLAGLSTGSYYALGAVGLTLVYGILKLVNFAHGDFLTFGAYMAYLMNVTWGLPLAVALVFGMATTAVLGIFTERIMWAPMRSAPCRPAPARADVDRAGVPDPLGDPVLLGDRDPLRST